MPSHHPFAADKPVLAWDGEGWEHPDTGKHIYGFLANSDGDERFSPDGLSTVECLRFIVDNGIDRLNVIFSGSYDVTLMLKDLTPEQAKESMKDSEETGFVKGTIYNGEFVIRYVPRKYLYIRDVNRKKGVMLWDVWGFFQGTFIAALEKWFGPDYDDLQIIHEGKLRRVKFTTDELPFIRRYNGAELRALVKLMTALISATKEAGLHLSRFDGAGAVASAMLKKAGIKERVFLDEKKQKITLPMEMRLPAEIAYYGGRIEAFQYGNADKTTVYHYDLNSAYPAVLIDLPNIGRGEWSYIENPDFSKCPEMSLFLVEWDVGNEIICPFPYRSQLQRKILYPTRGKSWIWYPEVFAALNAKKPDWSIKIFAAWVFHPEEPDDKPYAFIQDYYDRRAELVSETKRTGTPNGVEKIIKLGLNSLYGKTAQRVGAKPFHNLAYAGYITSATRAKLYAAGMQAPHAIIAFATDGIFSLAPLSLHCPTDKVLGAWEASQHNGMLLAQSGHYILDDSGEYRLWSRGFDKFAGIGEDEEARKKDYQQKVTEYRAKLISAWMAKEYRVYLACTRFCSLKSALQGDRWDKRGQWIPGHAEDLPGKELKIEPIDQKREVDMTFPQPNPAKGMVMTVPTENFSPFEMSAPYRQIEGGDEIKEMLASDETDIIQPPINI